MKAQDYFKWLGMKAKDRVTGTGVIASVISFLLFSMVLFVLVLFVALTSDKSTLQASQPFQKETLYVQDGCEYFRLVQNSLHIYACQCNFDRGRKCSVSVP